METIFDKACAGDYDEVVDFANYVFAHAHRPFDFPTLLPKLFKPEYFMDGAHYLAREGGKIKALVGSYPLQMRFPCESPGAPGNRISVPGRGIGTVSVHPYSRSKGYMKALMKMAIDDMKRDGAVFSCLGGQRQRYEYFGYTPAGSVYAFTCNETNIAHALGRLWDTGLSMEKLSMPGSMPGNGAALEQIHAMHESKCAYLYRPRDRLFETLSSWGAEIFVVTERGRFEGYLVHEHRAEGSVISEINMEDLSRLPEVIGLFLRGRKGQNTNVWVGPHEPEKIARLSGFAEGYIQRPAYQFAVFDHARFADPFVKLKAEQGRTREGAFLFRVEDKELGIDSRVRLRVGGNDTGVFADSSGEAPAVTMTAVEATGFLACPATAMTLPAIRENEFLRDILPLPVFWENADGV